MIDSCKKWSLCFLALVGTVTLLTVMANYVIDPLWCFSNINSVNTPAGIVDQRQQKTNKLTFERNSYDALILGSSRTEPVSQDDFYNLHAFNYAAPAMFPDEYDSYIEYFCKLNHDKVTTIFVGLDFFGTIETKPIENKPPMTYIDTSRERLYRFKSLITMDALRIYVKNYYKHANYYLYDRNKNILIPKDLSRYDRKKLLSDRLELLRDSFYSSNKYSYNPDYRKNIARLKAKYNQINIIVFTTPVTRPLFEALIREGRFDDYCRWIRDVVDVFNGVYNFMYVNSITENLDNYYDADHFFPKTGTLIAHKITGFPDENIPKDFGVYVTRDNLDEHLEFLRRQAESIIRNDVR